MTARPPASRRSPGARARRWALNAVLLVLSGAVSLLVLEFAVRIAFPAYAVDRQVRFIDAEGERPRLGPAGETFRQIKNAGDFDVTVAFNALGLRDSNLVSGAQESDVLVIGDSFTFGWGVAEGRRYSDLLGPALGTTAYNVAIPGDVPDYALLLGYARRLGARAERVVFGFCMENDLIVDPLPGTRPKSEPAPEEEPFALPDLLAVKAYLLRHSSLYFLATTVVHQSPALRDLATAAGLMAPPELHGMSALATPEIIERTADAVAGLTKGETAVVLIIPSRELWAGDNRAVAAAVHDATLGALRGRGIDVVDMRPVFEAGGDPLAFHFRHDGHWNETGHAAAARALAAYWRTRP